MLQQILGSHARAEILKMLFTPEHKTIHLREFSRKASLSAPVLQRELRQMAELGLISAEKDGNRVNFSANASHPLYSVLCDLVLKTEGAASLLERVFADSPAEFVFIFGSVAKGTANAESDIDLFVIGDCGLREITRQIHSVAPQIGQEVNPYAISKDEFIRRLHANDHFIREIVNTPKIFLKGTEDEFAAMAK